MSMKEPGSKLFKQVIQSYIMYRVTGQVDQKVDDVFFRATPGYHGKECLICG